LSTGADPQIYLNTIPRLPEVPLELQLWIKAERDLKSVSREMAEAAQAEVVRLREVLAQAELAGKERAMAAEVAEAELGAVRETLAKTEREAELRAAASAALQDDVVALRDTLTAAREVGTAAIAALRIGTAVPMKLDGPRGWWQIAVQCLGGPNRILKGCIRVKIPR